MTDRWPGPQLADTPGGPAVIAALAGSGPVAIDPFAPLVDGRYRDALVTVVGGATELPITDTPVARTASFGLWRHGCRLVLRHRIPDNRIDDSLTTVINDELFIPGWVAGSAVFESIFTGVVLTARPHPLDAWLLFYGNTLKHYSAID